MKHTPKPLGCTGKCKTIMSRPGGEDVRNVDPRKRTYRENVESNRIFYRISHALPHPIEQKQTYIYNIAAIACDAGGGDGAATFAFGEGGGWVFKIAPIMKKRVPIPIAEMNRETFRPKVSTPKKIKRVVAITFVIPSFGLRQVRYLRIKTKETRRIHHWLAENSCER